MRVEEIIKIIEKENPKFKDLAELIAIDKEGWIFAAITQAKMGDHKHFIRCENCIFHKCETIRDFKDEDSIIVWLWFSHNVDCFKFSPKPDADGIA